MCTLVSVFTATSRNNSTINSKRSLSLQMKLKHSTCTQNSIMMNSMKHLSHWWIQWNIYPTVQNLCYISWPWKWEEWVETKTIGIKCNVEHAILLKEMLLHTTKPSPGTKLIPTGITNTIGIETYIAMICNNNQWLTSATTIPVYGFTNETLELQITAFDPHTQTTVHHSICNILMDMPWCHGIETTQVVGKFLFITTKAHLHEGHQWLENNLLPLFTNYINKHPSNFIPNWQLL